MIDNKRMVHNLERVREQLKDRKYYTGDINFGYLLDDVIPKIHELIELKEKREELDKCNYCKSIDRATKKSPRKKYIYCPMCGRKR